MSIEEKVQAIYDLERNATISWFWDGGFEARIGDETNGWKDEGLFKTFVEAVDWLYSEIVLKNRSV